MTMWDQVSDVQRDAIASTVVGGFPSSGVPEHLRAGLVRYFSDGILPGGFLQAVLANDLRIAVKRADLESRRDLLALIDFLNTYAPSMAWGSREAVLAWTTTPNRLEV